MTVLPETVIMNDWLRAIANWLVNELITCYCFPIHQSSQNHSSFESCFTITFFNLPPEREAEQKNLHRWYTRTVNGWLLGQRCIHSLISSTQPTQPNRHRYSTILFLECPSRGLTSLLTSRSLVMIFFLIKSKRTYLKLKIEGQR